LRAWLFVEGGGRKNLPELGITRREGSAPRGAPDRETVVLGIMEGRGKVAARPTKREKFKL